MLRILIVFALLAVGGCSDGKENLTVTGPVVTQPQPPPGKHGVGKGHQRPHPGRGQRK